jgi:integration host factor subunit beta
MATKSEIINKLVAKLDHLSAKEIQAGVNVIFTAISDTLEAGLRVEVRNFGSFSIRKWGERFARNPATGKSWRTKPRKMPHFKPGSELRKRVNDAYLAEINAARQRSREADMAIKAIPVGVGQPEEEVA